MRSTCLMKIMMSWTTKKAEDVSLTLTSIISIMTTYLRTGLGDIYIPPPPSKPAYSGEETGIRLIITNIENINFKSYANQQILGPFHKVLAIH